MSFAGTSCLHNSCKFECCHLRILRRQGRVLNGGRRTRGDTPLKKNPKRKMFPTHIFFSVPHKYFLAVVLLVVVLVLVWVPAVKFMKFLTSKSEIYLVLGCCGKPSDDSFCNLRDRSPRSVPPPPPHTHFFPSHTAPPHIAGPPMITRLSPLHQKLSR